VNTPDIDQLLQENRELRVRLQDTEDAIRALQAGEADALFVESGGEQVYTLELPDKPYRLLVEQMHQGAATLTTDGKIIYCNARFIDLLRQPLHSLLGQPISRFAAGDSHRLLESLLLDGQHGDVEGEVTLQRADGSVVPAFLGVSIMQEGVLGSCLIIRDLSEQRHYRELQRTQESLRASEERLELAQRAGRIGTFEWNILTGAMSWSATMEELYGFPAGKFGGSYQDWKAAVHPNDQPRVEADHLRAVAERSELDTEFRILRPEGDTRWIASKAKLFPNGHSMRMLGVSWDITERRQLEEQLRAADRRKDEFLAILSHELRNPLAPIRNAVHILRAQPGLQSDWPLGVLDRQVRTMARLLDDLLDMSRISRQTVELRKERCELAMVLEAALETSRPVIEAARHQLFVNVRPEPIYLHADAMRLAQAFSNLLNNAAKYTEKGGSIWLTARQDANQAIISVRDSGIGIAAEMLPQLFEIFWQATDAVRRSQGGLGIGLSLVKGLVELHGGSVEARSEGPSKGSEFIVRLPVAGTIDAA
jgi:PAS domain S-box-containing protein